MKINVIFLTFFFLGLTIFGQMSMMPYNQLLDKNLPLSQKDKLEQIQAAFIEELFVKQLFETPEIIEFDDDPIYDTKESNQLMNTLYAREISRKLAKQDLLNLNDLMRN